MSHLRTRRPGLRRAFPELIILLAPLWAIVAAAGPSRQAWAQGGAENEACRPKMDLRVVPMELHAGNALSASSSLSIDCRDVLLPADIVYVIQRSSWADHPLGPVTDAQRLQNTLAGVATSLQETLRRGKGSRIAVVSFDGSARLHQALGDDPLALAESLDGIRLGSTERDPAAGLDRAATLLGDADRRRVVIWIGGNTVKDEGAARRSVQRLVARGIQLAYVGLESIEPFYTTLPDEVARIGADASRSIAPWVSGAHGLFQAVRIDDVELRYRRSPGFVWGPAGPGRPPREGVDERARFLFESDEAHDRRSFYATALGPGTAPLFDMIVARIRYSTGNTYDLPFPNPPITVLGPRSGSPRAAPGPPPRLERVDAMDAERGASFPPGEIAYLSENELLALGPDRIYLLDPRSTAVSAWPCECPADWRPALLATDLARGRVFAVDARTESTWVFDRTGRRLAELAPPERLAGGRPSWVVDLAIAPSGQVYLLQLQRQQPVGARLNVRAVDAALTNATEWEARTPAGWLSMVDLDGGPRSWRRDWAKLAVQGDEHLVIWTENHIRSNDNDWRLGFNRYDAQGRWQSTWDPVLPADYPGERSDGLVGRWDLIGVDQELWVQRLGWLLRYAPDGDLARSGRLEAKLRWWSGGFDFFGALRADLRGPDAITHGLAPRPGGGMSFPVAGFFLPGIADADSFWRLWPDYGLETILRSGGSWNYAAGILTLSADAQWSAFVSTIERPPIEFIYPELAEGVDLLRGARLGDGSWVVSDPLAFGLRTWLADGRRGFQPLPFLPLDLAAGPGDDLAVLGIDAQGLAVFRRSRAGDPVWRQSCDCAVGQGVAVVGDEIAVAARRGGGVLRFGWSRGEPLGELRGARLFGLGPVDVHADPLDPTGLLGLNLRQRRIERWRLPPSGAAGSGQTGEADRIWSLAPDRGALDIAVAPDGTVALTLVDGRVRVQDRQGAVLAEWQPADGGYPALPTDLIWSADGRSLAVLDGRLAPQLGRRPRLLSFAWPPPPADPRATPTAGASSASGACTLHADTSLDRERVTVGESLRVSHTVHAACPAGAELPVDVILALLPAGPALDSAPLKRAADGLVESLDPDKDRVGVHGPGLGVNGICFMQQVLTPDRARITPAIAATESQGCRPTLDMFRELDAGGREHALPVVVALAQGNPATGGQAGIDQSALYHAYLVERGVPIHVLELRPPTGSPLVSLATGTEDYEGVSDEGRLVAAARDLGRSLTAVTLREVALESVWNADLDFVPGSIVPSQGFPQADRVRLERASAAPGDFTLSYALRARVPGRYPVTSSAAFYYTEADGRPRRLGIASREVQVDAPPPSPTPSPAPRPAYLPFARNEAGPDDFSRSAIAPIPAASNRGIKEESP